MPIRPDIVLAGKAKLDGADLSDANLEGVEGLTQAQLDRAQLNSETKLPEGFDRVENAER